MAVTVGEVFHELFRAYAEGDDDTFASLWVVDDPSVTRWGLDLSFERAAVDWDDLEIHKRVEVAWVNARGTITEAGRSRPCRLTGVLLHNYAGWRWHTLNLSADA